MLICNYYFWNFCLLFSLFCLLIQKGDSLLLKQEDASRLVMDGDDEQYHEKPANRATFHRPFLDAEDSSPPEKWYKLSGSEVQNGMCAVPVHTGSLPAVVQKTPLCTSNLKSSGNSAEDGSRCESSKLNDRQLCESDCNEMRDEDGGRDRLLNAALGLISLSDVNSDESQVHLTSSTETTAGDCSDGQSLLIPVQCTENCSSHHLMSSSNILSIFY